MTCPVTFWCYWKHGNTASEHQWVLGFVPGWDFLKYLHDLVWCLLLYILVLNPACSAVHCFHALLQPVLHVRTGWFRKWEAKYFQLSWEKFRTIDQGGKKPPNYWTWTCMIIWAIVLISCPPYMISLKVISLFSLEGKFCDYSSLLLTMEFFFPPNLFPNLKKWGWQGFFQPWGWFAIKHVRKTHGEHREQ